MSPGLALLFWSLVLFETKHFVCDFVLQTQYQKQNKERYGHPGGLIHAGLQGVGSLPAIVLLTHSVLLIAGIVVAEFVVHYHIDWLKERIVKNRRWNTEIRGFWQVFGADQMLHNFTYVGIIGVLWPGT